MWTNVGGVLASYYEWMQNCQQLPWDRGGVLSRLENGFNHTCDIVRKLVDEKQVNLRAAL